MNISFQGVSHQDAGPRQEKEIDIHTYFERSIWCWSGVQQVLRFQVAVHDTVFMQVLRTETDGRKYSSRSAVSTAASVH